MSDKTGEVMARAIHDHWQNNHRSWEETNDKLPAQARDFRRKGEAAFAALEQAGYVVVPKEPTQEMVRAYVAADPRRRRFAASAKRDYRAMLSTLSVGEGK